MLPVAQVWFPLSDPDEPPDDSEPELLPDALDAALLPELLDVLLPELSDAL